ncbi:hypothetical protein [Amycolatopsis sp.]|uniref:hypothetical protein n=1 Tax=Amycolatopsis sp. TaxID=37632 RepID=UPI002B795D59|nr:hypothetical protein [Amycolatopsis sp.]HVV10615.1 hypothetical protein [Amycolatopsis sp.]
MGRSPLPAPPRQVPPTPPEQYGPGDRHPSTGGHGVIPPPNRPRPDGFQAFGRPGGTGGQPRTPAEPRTSTGGYAPVEQRPVYVPVEHPADRRTGTGPHKPVERRMSTGTHKPVERPGAGQATSTEKNPSAGTGSHRAIKPVEGRSSATGTHRALTAVAGRRKIAKWPIFTGVAVVLIVVGLLGWGWANNVLNSRAEAQANACTDGTSTLKVVVTPTIEKPVTTAATRWNQANTVVHAHCVHIDVRSVPSQQVLDALTGKTGTDAIGGFPAAWIPENSFWISKLQTANAGLIGSPSESVASQASADYPFVGLGGANVDDIQARAAQVFRDFLKEPAQQADFTSAGLTPA